MRPHVGRITEELAVHIRLRRVGKTKAPTYRVVIADSRAPRNGKFIESIGHYNQVDCKVLEEIVSYLRTNH